MYIGIHFSAIGQPFGFRVVAAASAQNALAGFSLDATQIPCTGL